MSARVYDYNRLERRTTHSYEHSLYSCCCGRTWTVLKGIENAWNTFSLEAQCAIWLVGTQAIACWEFYRAGETKERDDVFFALVALLMNVGAWLLTVGLVAMNCLQGKYGAQPDDFE